LPHLFPKKRFPPQRTQTLNTQYDEYGYRETKTKVKHHISLTGELIEDLKKLIEVNGQGFLFSLDGAAKAGLKIAVLDKGLSLSPFPLPRKWKSCLN
jgi:hypothetical protein